MERFKQQSDLIFKLGLLLRPLSDIVNSPEQYNARTRSRIWARFSVEIEAFSKAFRAFCKGEEGHFYQREDRKFRITIAGFTTIPDEKLDDIDELKKLLDEFSDTLREIILTIPVLMDGAILEKYTPFSTYCVLKDLCLSSSKTLTLVDRYLDNTLFYRYFRDVHKSVQVTLITWHEAKYTAASWAKFLDVSRLYAGERGSKNYRLLANENIHDRFLCLDDNIYSLGGSLKAAGKQTDFTITKVPSTPENEQKIAQIIANASEIFGQNNPMHP